jgi:hypothetical protein
VSLGKKLSRLFRVTPQERDDLSYMIAVQCDRCGEIIRSRVNLSDDLSANYDEDGNITNYFCRKVLIGRQRCFRPIEVLLTFDAQRRLKGREITGGRFVEE